MGSWKRWPVMYYINGKKADVQPGAMVRPPTLAIGTGIAWPDGRQFRVKDVWVSYASGGVEDEIRPAAVVVSLELDDTLGAEG